MFFQPVCHAYGPEVSAFVNAPTLRVTVLLLPVGQQRGPAVVDLKPLEDTSWTSKEEPAALPIHMLFTANASNAFEEVCEACLVPEIGSSGDVHQRFAKTCIETFPKDNEDCFT